MVMCPMHCHLVDGSSKKVSKEDKKVLEKMRTAGCTEVDRGSITDYRLASTPDEDKCVVVAATNAIAHAAHSLGANVLHFMESDGSYTTVYLSKLMPFAEKKLV